MKRAILTGALVCAFLFPSYALASGFYVGTYGGANWDSVTEFSGVTTDTGAVIGGTVGTGLKAVPGLRVEADISFRQNVTDVALGCCFAVSADHDTWALMGNVAYDLRLFDGITPYALFGAGYASTQATFENIALARLESAGIAWQTGVGVNVAVADGVTVGAGYRYFDGPSLTVLGTELSSGANHAVLGEVRFAFD
jgi:opacity protein-like surface antigen